MRQSPEFDDGEHAAMAPHPLLQEKYGTVRCEPDSKPNQEKQRN
jgi:hypothetical protein